MHGLIAGLWSSLSGLGRFVSRVGSGILVDVIGFNYTAAIATVLQLIVVSIWLILGWVGLGRVGVGLKWIKIWIEKDLLSGNVGLNLRGPK